MADNDRQNRIELPGLSDADLHMMLETINEFFITLAAPNLVIDAHMHIESNNCCPLPIQWALVSEKTFGIFSRGQDDREKLGDSSTNAFLMWLAGIGTRFGTIGLMNTDQVAQMFTSIVETMNQGETGVYLFNTSEEILDPAKAKTDADYKELTDPMKKEYTDDFIKNCAYYFFRNRLFHLFIALPMDLSFAHYWGRNGLPINLALNQGLSFINDFTRVELIKSTHNSNNTFIRLNDKVYTPRTEITSAAGDWVTESEHLHADYDLAAQYRNYRAFLDSGKASGKFFFRFDAAVTENMVKRGYKHFVELLPQKENDAFEDYKTQIRYTIKAGVRSAFTLLPFYHYDPRRHYLEQSRITELAGELAANHAFFGLKADNNLATSFTDGSRHTGAVHAVPLTEMNDSRYVAALLEQKMRSNSGVYSMLINHPAAVKPLFWGIKMYCRLGYAADDFTHYPHLDDFYSNCMAHGIPITCHMSPGGMTFADRHNYLHFDGHNEQAEYSMKDSMRFINDTMANPGNWEQVLKKYGNLKVNLAHFTGYDIWREKHDWIKSFDYKHYGDWIDTIARMTNQYTNLYTDLAFYNNPDPFLFWDERTTIANDLADYLAQYPGLKDRLLMGSDWYMTEMAGFKGIGSYFRKMFLLLKAVSKKVGYDAWHQFAVINPLRFLGLIPEEKGGSGPYSINMKRLTQYKDCVLGYLNDTGWLWRNKMEKSNIKGLTAQVDRLYRVFETLPPLQDSAEIKNEAGELLILSK